MKQKERVILLEDSKIGSAFEIKEFKRGFVFKYLLPNNMVILYNEKNKTKLEELKKLREEKEKELEEQAKIIFNKINNHTITFELKKNEKGNVFGSVNSKEILDSLENTFKLKITDNKLINFVPLNTLGEHVVKIKLNKNVIAEIKISIC